MQFPAPSSVLYAFLAVILVTVSAQVPQESTVQYNNSCVTKENCHECIQTPSCAWCSEPKLSSNARCFLPSHVKRDYCDEKYIYDPVNKMGIIFNVPYGSKSGGSITQVSFPKMNLKLRARSPWEFAITFKQRQSDLEAGTSSAVSPTVEMKHNASSAVNVKFFTECLKSDGGDLVVSNNCGSIKAGSSVEFKVGLEVVECPENHKDWRQTIEIYPVGVNDSSLVVDLQMMCDCPCERPANYIENARQCQGQGTYCEKPVDPNGNCTSPLNNLECSGRGICVCGTCACEMKLEEWEIIYGDYCECDNFSCERIDGELCGGPEHGKCTCGKCECKPEWTKSHCGCIKSNATCIASDATNGEICSGNGTCSCGECICNETADGKFFGLHCEKCPTCEPDEPDS